MDDALKTESAPDDQRPARPCARRAYRLLRWASCLGALGLAAVFCCDAYVSATTQSRLHRAVDTAPEADVALVLGTAPTFDGRPNLFYTARIAAAAELFHAGKVRGIIVSGDHGRKDYNEPGAMKADLVKAGVPAEFITEDFAGFRTLDSVVRAQAVFGQQRVIVVSQAFHSQRALFLADAHGLTASAYAAEDAPAAAHAKLRLREAFARTAAVLDVYVLGREPRFYGPRETVAMRN